MVKEDLFEFDLSGYKGILWDLDNTLYAYEPVHGIAFKTCSEYAFQKYKILESEFETNWHISRKRVHKDLNRQAASHSRLLYFQKIHELMFGYTNAEFTLEMETLYWNTFIHHLDWNPGFEDFLKKAKEKGLRMCIVSDLTAQIQLQKWVKLGLQRYMDFMVSSEEAGLEKPDEKMFTLALEKLGLKSDEVIMVGDNYEKDIVGAEALGIKSFWIK